MRTARPWSTRARRRLSLRSRLTIGLVGLVVLVLVGAGLAMTVALRSFLVQQLDRELVSTANGLAASETFDPSGLRDGTVVVETDASGLLLEPPVLIASPGDRHDDDDRGEGRDGSGGDDGLTLEGVADLQKAGDVPDTRDIAGLGSYRVVQVTDAQGHVITVGLPLRSVTETLTRLLLIEGLTLASAAVAVALGGGWLVRRELLPLDRVARTAREVASLPLTEGSQRLDQRVPAEAPGTEIGDVTEALNDMLDHLDLSLEERAETERQLRQFVADASHELRTPLTSIQGYAELYRRHEVSEDDRQLAMRRIEAEADRMRILVDDLLLLARLDQGRPLLKEDVDLSLVVAEICNDFAVTTDAHPISVDLPDAPVVVVGDEGRLRQVVTNLLANAVQHTPPQTPVRVSVAVKLDVVVLTVADRGPGIPREFQAHAFDRFARADASRARASGGSGLGLSIVAAVVAAHGGHVRLTSSNAGTSVAVELPRRK